MDSWRIVLLPAKYETNKKCLLPNKDYFKIIEELKVAATCKRAKGDNKDMLVSWMAVHLSTGEEGTREIFLESFWIGMKMICIPLQLSVAFCRESTPEINLAYVLKFCLPWMT